MSGILWIAVTFSSFSSNQDSDDKNSKARAPFLDGSQPYNNEMRQNNGNQQYASQGYAYPILPQFEDNENPRPSPLPPHNQDIGAQDIVPPSITQTFPTPRSNGPQYAHTYMPQQAYVYPGPMINYPPYHMQTNDGVQMLRAENPGYHAEYLPRQRSSSYKHSDWRLNEQSIPTPSNSRRASASRERIRRPSYMTSASSRKSYGERPELFEYTGRNNENPGIGEIDLARQAEEAFAREDEERYNRARMERRRSRSRGRSRGRSQERLYQESNPQLSAGSDDIELSRNESVKSGLSKSERARIHSLILSFRK